MTRRTNAPLDDNEEARPIRGWPMYLVSREGRIYSTVATQSGGPPTELVRRIKPRRGPRDNRAPRYRVSVGPASKRVYLDVASVVCEAFHGPRPDGGIIEFTDGNSLNCHADNLGWKITQSGVSDREFVVAWQSSQSVAECADRLGLSNSSVWHRAKKLIDRGVRLRDMRIKTDIDLLNELLDDMDENS